MRVEQQLIENYWTSLYTGDMDKLEGLLAPDIRVTIIKPAPAEPKILSSRNELVDLARAISAKLEVVFGTDRQYSFRSPEIRVDFQHHIQLTTGTPMQTQGYQKWTTKIGDDGKMVLASLEVSETLIPLSQHC